MPSTRRLLLLLSLCGLLVAAWHDGGLRLAAPARVSAAPADRSGPPDVGAELHHDVSPPLRQQPPLHEERGPREKPLRRTPPGQSTLQTDPVVQSSAGPAVATSSGFSFAGVGNGDYGFVPNAAPPDTNGAVGGPYTDAGGAVHPGQYVQWVNESFAIFDKSTGALLYGPAAGNSLWHGFSGDGGQCANNNSGDPIAQYDKAAQRWVLTQPVFTAPYELCVAVSTSPDATGTWNRYAFGYGSTQFPDYPKLGIWPDAYYTAYNIFNNGSAWAGAKVCALDRTSMLAGSVATQQCFQLSTNDASLLPADLDGTSAPPAGAPHPYLNFGTNALNLWQFHVDWANAANTTLTGPTSLPVAAFTPACNGGTCIPQPGTTQQLDTLADRLMYRLAYRNFPTGTPGAAAGSADAQPHESLVVNQSVSVGTTGVGLRWYELRNPSSTPTVYQQGTYAPDASDRWMGSIAMDQAGDIAVGYSVASSSVYPAIRSTGRVPADPPGTLEAETSLKAGGGSQTGGLSRWGDYSSLSVDPVDDCTFWYTNEYLKAGGSFNWSTWISSFSFPGCGSPPTPDFALALGSQSPSPVVQGSPASYSVTITPLGGFTGDVSLSATSLPSGATATFTQNPASSSSTLTIATSSSLAPNSYQFTVTGTSGSLTHTVGGTLVVSAVPTPDYSLGASPSSRTVRRGSSTTYTVTVSPGGGFSDAVTLSVSKGLPAGTTASFSSNPTTSGATLTVRTSSSTPLGSFTLTIQGVDSLNPSNPSLTHTTTVTLGVSRH